jgi:hypothetical protein
MTPEQLRDHLYGKWDVRESTIRRRAIRDAEDKDVEEACAKYRIPVWPEWAGKRPERGISSIEWFKRESAPLPGIEHSRLEDDPLYQNYQRHTVDIKGPAPQFVEDEMLAVERGVRWAKVAWVVLGVLVAGYVVWRVLGGTE